MSAERQMVLDTAERIFASADSAPDTIWPAIVEAGLPALLLAESEGGFGGDWGDAFSLLRLAGYHAVSAAFGDAIIGVALFGGDAIASYEGKLALAEAASGKLEAGRFTGRLRGVASGRNASLILAAIGPQVIALDTQGAKVLHGKNLAGDPCDVLQFSQSSAVICKSPAPLFALGALPRVAQIAGALEASLAMSIGHANERQQFGKPIGKFQAVQQNLAVFAEAAAAVNCAGLAAFLAAGHSIDSQTPFDPEFEIAAAKLRANIAVDAGAAIAHQVHGGIGFTQEHALHRFTRRLYAWRGEFGNERFWAERLAKLACSTGGEALWPHLTARSDLIDGAAYD